MSHYIIKLQFAKFESILLRGRYYSVGHFLNSMLVVTLEHLLAWFVYCYGAQCIMGEAIKDSSSFTHNMVSFACLVCCVMRTNYICRKHHTFFLQFLQSNADQSECCHYLMG